MEALNHGPDKNLKVLGGEHNIDKAPRSPGMKYTHYAPRAPLYLIQDKGNKKFLEQVIRNYLKTHTDAQVGLLYTASTNETQIEGEPVFNHPNVICVRCGKDSTVVRSFNVK